MAGGSFRAFEVQTQQCVDRFWDLEFVSVFGIPLWTQPWRIPGPEGHVVSLGTWGSYLTRFVLIWDPKVGRVGFEFQSLCVNAAAGGSGVLKE